MDGNGDIVQKLGTNGLGLIQTNGNSPTQCAQGERKTLYYTVSIEGSQG